MNGPICQTDDRIWKFDTYLFEGDYYVIQSQNIVFTKHSNVEITIRFVHPTPWCNLWFESAYKEVRININRHFTALTDGKFFSAVTNCTAICLRLCKLRSSSSHISFFYMHARQIIPQIRAGIIIAFDNNHVIKYMQYEHKGARNNPTDTITLNIENWKQSIV